MTPRQLQSLRNIGGLSEDAADEIDQLQADLAAARADAVRYRWLRSARTGKLISAVTTGSAWRCTLNTVELDAAIDAALAGERREGE